MTDLCDDTSPQLCGPLNVDGQALQDADGDTFIKMEASPDSDQIEFGSFNVVLGTAYCDGTDCKWELKSDSTNTDPLLSLLDSDDNAIFSFDPQAGFPSFQLTDGAGTNAYACRVVSNSSVRCGQQVGTDTWVWNPSSGSVEANISNGWRLAYRNLGCQLENRSDTDTCVGWSADDTVFLQAGDVKMVEGVEDVQDYVALLTQRHFGPLSATPTASAAGDRYYDTDDLAEWLWDGTRWAEVQTDQYGSLLETDADNACDGSSITIATEGTYVGWTTAGAGPLQIVTADTADATADHLTATVAGAYEINLSASFGGSQTDIVLGISKNEAITDYRHVRTLGTGSPRGSVSISGAILDLAAADRIGIMTTCTETPGNCSGDSIDICHMSLSIRRLGS